MNEEEARQLVAAKFKGKAVPVPRRVRLTAWLIEVVHPLVHHRVRHVMIRKDGLVIDNGWVCRLCGKPM